MGRGAPECTRERLFPVPFGQGGRAGQPGGGQLAQPEAGRHSGIAGEFLGPARFHGKTPDEDYLVAITIGRPGLGDQAPGLVEVPAIAIEQDGGLALVPMEEHGAQ